MKAIVPALLFLLPLSAAGARPIDPPISPPPAPHHQARTLMIGIHGIDVLHYNQRLARLGYLPPMMVGSRFTEASMHATVAVQKWHSIMRDGVAGPVTRRRLAHAIRPRPRLKAQGRRAEILLGKQLVLLIDNNRVIYTIAISSAAPGFVTPLGHHNVYRKERMSWSRPYSVWLPWASYFSGGVAFHQYPDVPVYPASHGCVRVPQPFAYRLYLFLYPGAAVDVLP